MSNPRLTPHDKWQSFTCDCVWQHGLQISGNCEGMCDIPSGYLAGRKPANYPVPALNNEVWICWGSDQGKPMAYVSLVRNNGDESYTLIRELAEKTLI